MIMKGDFVLENRISESTKETALWEARSADTEPYVGMPVCLDDDFFKFMGAGNIGIECPEPDRDEIMDDMDDNNSETMPNPDNSGNNGMECVVGCPLAMAYVPWQQWETPFDMEEGFRVGTVFPSLDLPFLGGAK